MQFTMNFEWFMRFASTSHFDWVAFPQRVCNGVVASTVETKDSLSSDECSSSGRSEPYPLLSVSKINAVCMISLLWVGSGMSSIHVCCIFRKDPRECSHGCWKYCTSSICACLGILNGLGGLWPLLTLSYHPSWSLERSGGIHSGD